MVKSKYRYAVLLGAVLSLVLCLGTVTVAEAAAHTHTHTHTHTTFTEGVCSCGAVGGECGADGDNLIWLLDTDGTLTVSGTGAMKDHSRASDAPWYNDRDKILALVIADGVVSVGNRAFSGCLNLANITFPTSLNTIGDYSFYGCTGLTAVTVPGTVTSMGLWALYGCTGLRTAGPVGSGCDYEFGWTNYIPSYAFNGCSGLTSITIPESITSIGYSAFASCSNLTSIMIPDSVTSVGNWAFAGCTGLQTAGPAGSGCNYEFGWRKAIPSNAFSGCSSLTSITIPAEVTSIGSYAFSGCTKLRTAGPIGSGCDYEFGWTKTIPSHAFSGCRNLASITLPKSVTSIGMQAFYGCTGLTSITFPDGMTSIGRQAFYGCTGLTSITFPSSVTSIGKHAFYGCTDLTSITFSGNAPSIGVFTFYGVVADAYYPHCNETWTGVAGESYSGTLTWTGLHNYHTSTVIAPTCTEKGYTAHACACGDIRKDSYVDALGHDTAVCEAQLPTCTEPGWDAYMTCRRCDYTTYAQLPALGHKWGAGSVAIPPSANMAGSMKYTCEGCGDDMFADIPRLPAAPTGVTAVSGNYNSVLVTWEQVEGAQQYQVWRSTDPNTGFKCIGSFDADTTSAVSKSLSCGTTYYYKVRACCSIEGTTYYGAYSTVASATPQLAAPTGVKASANTYNSLKISWSKVEGAQYYQVYRYIPSTNKWGLLGVYDADTFQSVSRSLGCGTEYTYRIRAYRWAAGQRVFSDYSEEFTGTPELSAPTGVTATPTSKTTVGISWNSVDGATYYQVYRRELGKNGWALLGTYGEDTTSSVSKSLKTGVTYEYRVRCYRWVSGDPVFSDHSTIVTATPQ